MYFVTLMTPGQEYKVTKITFSHIISPHLHCHLLGKHYAASHLAGWKNTYLFNSLAKILKKIQYNLSGWCFKIDFNLRRPQKFAQSSSWFSRLLSKFQNHMEDCAICFAFSETLNFNSFFNKEFLSYICVELKNGKEPTKSYWKKVIVQIYKYQRWESKSW